MTPCNITAYVPPPAPPFLIFGFLDPLTFAVIMIFLLAVAGYYYRKRYLRLALIESMEIKTLEGEVHKRRFLRRAKMAFDAMDYEGSGNLSRRQFSKFLGITGHSAWVERLMAVFDTDGGALPRRALDVFQPLCIYVLLA